MLPYLQVIHLCKLYQDDLIQYNNLFDEKMNVQASNTKELTQMTKNLQKLENKIKQR